MSEPKVPQEAEQIEDIGFISPMKAMLTKDYFSDAQWLYERKFDGQRCVAVNRNGAVTLYSRNKKVRNATYPELVEELQKQPGNRWVIDGEIVAFEGNVTSFSRLQNRMQLKDPSDVASSNVAVYFYIFDCMHIGDHDIRAVPLEKRKQLLKESFRWDAPHVRFTVHRRKEGERYLAQACEKGWEGLIAKRADSLYNSSRSRDWLKFKCVSDQEFVIGGYTAPHGSRTGFGAILVGYYDDKHLRYAGKVGTGYDEDTLNNLKHRFDRLTQSDSPFADLVEEDEVTWLEPQLVAEIGFTEWTAQGKLRHPRFKGLRDDKSASEVVKETPRV